MKIQTKAIVRSLKISGDQVTLPSPKTIDLEFSAIDTGGGFRDPILDFSFRLDDGSLPEFPSQKTHAITFGLAQQEDDQQAVEMNCEVPVNEVSDDRIEINGRLKEDQLSRELIGFVLNLLR